MNALNEEKDFLPRTKRVCPQGCFDTNRDTLKQGLFFHGLLAPWNQEGSAGWSMTVHRPPMSIKTNSIDTKYWTYLPLPRKKSLKNLKTCFSIARIIWINNAKDFSCIIMLILIKPSRITTGCLLDLSI